MSSARGDGPVVLFVDDDERLLDSFRLALRKEPFELVTVSSVERAERALAQRAIDVIVCDERMPTISGTAFLAKLRKQAHPAIRIVLSGAGQHAARRAVEDAGVFCFLAKPCSVSAVAAAIRDALSVSSLIRAWNSENDTTPFEVIRNDSLVVRRKR